MAYEGRKFEAEFESRMLVRLTELLERDTKDALAEAGITEPFADFRTPTPIALNFPALFVSFDRAQIAQSDDDTHVAGEYTFTVDVSLIGADAFTVQEQLTRYLLAIDRVIRAASVEDLTGGVTQSVSKPVWEVTEHTSALFRVDSTVLRADGSLTIVIQLLEL